MAGSHDDAVGLRIRRGLPGVEAEDRVGEHRCGGEAVTLIDERGHLGGGKDLEHGEERGFAQCVGVTA